MASFRGVVHLSLLAGVWYCFFVIPDAFSLVRPTPLHPVRIRALVDLNSTTGKDISKVPLRPVRIGALVDLNSTTGKDISKALHLALRNVNQRRDLLNGTQFQLEIADCGCDPVQGAVSAVELIEKEAVFILGPQSSVVAHFIAHLGKAAKVPVLSYGATDPSLAEEQYSYFFRVLPSDELQMEAIADFIAIFDWTQVAVIYTDDDYGANGASVLRQYLQDRNIKLIAEAKVGSDSSQAEIREQLMNLDDTQSRVFVLHTPRMLGNRVLSEANDLHMLMFGYVWIVTDLSVTEVQMMNPDIGTVQSFKGVLGTRRFIFESTLYKDLKKQWQQEYPGDVETSVSKQLNPYAVYAYDAFYAAALAISYHIAQGHTLTFNAYYRTSGAFGGQSDFRLMKILESGPALRQSLMRTTFEGASGLIQFADGKMKNAVFEYVNSAGMDLSVVAYWAHKKNISILPPQSSINFTSEIVIRGANATSLNITWPGGGTKIPQGWAPNKDGKPLKIGVPRKAGYNELVRQTIDSNNVTRYGGFCIVVFETAIKQLNYAVTYEFVSYSSNIVGRINPVYDDVVKMVATGELDAAVGDITITSERLRLVDFTQPYIEAGLVVLVKKIDRSKGDPLAFLRPFTAIMWLTILGFTLFVGFIIWLLEHDHNPDFSGPRERQLAVVLWFMFSTLFTAHREETKGVLARTVLILWLFIVLIVNSSYTASLTAILTVEQLTPAISGLDSLRQSNDPIGFQTGSFVQNYLIGLGISAGRLKDLGSLEAYKTALDLGPNNGGVMAIVDELPYIQIFLATNCKHYAMAGQIFTKSGWGFAFPRGSEIAQDLSTEILSMSQTGQLSRIHDYYIKEQDCTESNMTVEDQSNRLGIQHFWVLFMIMGATSIVCISAFTVLQARGRIKELLRRRRV